jgi:hypothetical protein
VARQRVEVVEVDPSRRGWRRRSASRRPVGWGPGGWTSSRRCPNSRRRRHRPRRSRRTSGAPQATRLDSTVASLSSPAPTLYRKQKCWPVGRNVLMLDERVVSRSCLGLARSRRSVVGLELWKMPSGSP